MIVREATPSPFSPRNISKTSSEQNFHPVRDTNQNVHINFMNQSLNEKKAHDLFTSHKSSESNPLKPSKIPKYNNRLNSPMTGIIVSQITNQNKSEMNGNSSKIPLRLTKKRTKASDESSLKSSSYEPKAPKQHKPIDDEEFRSNQPLPDSSRNLNTNTYVKRKKTVQQKKSTNVTKQSNEKSLKLEKLINSATFEKLVPVDEKPSTPNQTKNKVPIKKSDKTERPSNSKVNAKSSPQVSTVINKSKKKLNSSSKNCKSDKKAISALSESQTNLIKTSESGKPKCKKRSCFPKSRSLSYYFKSRYFSSSHYRKFKNDDVDFFCKYLSESDIVSLNNQLSTDDKDILHNVFHLDTLYNNIDYILFNSYASDSELVYDFNIRNGPNKELINSNYQMFINNYFNHDYDDEDDDESNGLESDKDADNPSDIREERSELKAEECPFVKEKSEIELKKDLTFKLSYNEVDKMRYESNELDEYLIDSENVVERLDVSDLENSESMCNNELLYDDEDVEIIMKKAKAKSFEKLDSDEKRIEEYLDILYGEANKKDSFTEEINHNQTDEADEEKMSQHSQRLYQSGVESPIFSFQTLSSLSSKSCFLKYSSYSSSSSSTTFNEDSYKLKNPSNRPKNPSKSSNLTNFEYDNLNSGQFIFQITDENHKKMVLIDQDLNKYSLKSLNDNLELQKKIEKPKKIRKISNGSRKHCAKSYTIHSSIILTDFFDYSSEEQRTNIIKSLIQLPIIEIIPIKNDLTNRSLSGGKHLKPINYINNSVIPLIPIDNKESFKNDSQIKNNTIMEKIVDKTIKINDFNTDFYKLCSDTFYNGSDFNINNSSVST